MAKSKPHSLVASADRKQYVPGPEYELVQSGSMAAAPAGSGDTWLLQLPHHWPTSVGTELRMRSGSGQTTTAACNDDEGTTYAVEVEDCKAGQPIYVFVPRSGQVQLQPCSRKATWIHSQAVLASHEEEAHPLPLPSDRKQTSSTVKLATSHDKAAEPARVLQNGEKSKKAAKRTHEGEQTPDKRKKTAKVKKEKKPKV